MSEDASRPGSPATAPGAPAAGGGWVMARALRRPAAGESAGPAAALLAERRVEAGLQALLTSRPIAPRPTPPTPPSPAWHDAEPPDADGWDVTVVVDGGVSMEFWSPVADEVVALLGRMGLCSQRGASTLATDDGAPHPPGTAPTFGHDAAGEPPPVGGPVLLLTDGLAPAWHNGGAAAVLHGWARRSPVAVVHLLPEDLWSSTGIRPRPRALRPRSPGAPSAEVDWEEAQGGAVPVPVLQLRYSHLARWAESLAYGPERWRNLPTILVPRAHGEAPSRGHDRDGDGERGAAYDLARDPADPVSARHLVADFRGSASVNAQTLAAGLAAVPLNLPVMRYVQSRLIPGSAPDLLSEIFIADLLAPVAPREDLRSPGRVTFDFRDGVRELLLAPVTKARTADIFGDAVRFLAHELGVSEVAGWDRLITNPRNNAPFQVTERSEPFLRVQLAVLRALSGPYETPARQLAEELASAQATGSDRFPDRPGMSRR